MAGMLLLGAGPAFSQTQPAPDTKAKPAPENLKAKPAPDNTKVNRNDPGPTAGQQKENEADRELTQKIRKAITSDKAMSTYAKNVKIITQDGKVTLKGPVRTEEEKKAIEAKASEVAGMGNVTNEISIAKKRS
jgi:osmotically-inducible protein OsmY